MASSATKARRRRNGLCGDCGKVPTGSQYACVECREKNTLRKRRTYVATGREPARGEQTTAEIARALGCSRQLVEKIEARALAKLRRNPRLLELLKETG